MKISGEEPSRELAGWSEQLLYYWNVRGALAAGESDGGGIWGQRGLREGRLVQAGPLKDFGFYCRRVGLSLKSFEQRCNLV